MGHSELGRQSVDVVEVSVGSDDQIAIQMIPYVHSLVLVLLLELIFVEGSIVKGT